MNRKTFCHSPLCRFFTAPLLLALLALSLTAQANGPTEEEIEASVAAGLAWLAGQQDASGSFGGDCNAVGFTGLAVAKFIDRAHDLGEDPLDSTYEYYTNVVAGLGFIMSHAHTIAISTEPAGDPDGDSDGIGVYFTPCNNPPYHVIYQTGIAMMALASSGDSATYGAAVQDAVDFLAWAQADPACGVHRGGWRYSPDECTSDNSNSGYAALGLAYAAAPSPHGFGLTIPQWVKDEFSIWLDVIQDDVDGDSWDGGSWYDPGNGWVNILKTGNLLHEFGLVGDTCETQRVKDAVDYIERHWTSPTINCWAMYSNEGWLDNPQAMFTLMKGLESMGIDLIDLDNDSVPEHDWFAEVAQHLIDTQNADGSWPGDCWTSSSTMSTSWALLTLEKAVPTFDIEVAVDIKPTSCRNPFNVDKKGLMPVAIVGGEDCDVTKIDPATIMLEGVSPLRWNYEDVATPFEPFLGKEDAFDCTEEGADGYLDMTLKFDALEMAAALGSVADGDVLVVPLTGNLLEEFGGTPIVGEDVIVILKKK